MVNAGHNPAIADTFDDAALNLDQARWLIADGRPHDAIPLLRSAVDHHPLDAEVRTELAHAHLLSRDPEAAASIAQEAAALSTAHEWSRRLLAFALLTLGKPGDAIVAARSALAIDPANLHSLKALFEAQLQLKLLRDAGQTARVMIEMAPDAAAPHTDLAPVHLIAGDAVGAEREARKAIAIDPEDTGSRNVLASALRSQNRAAEALSEYTTAASMDPDDRFSRRQITATVDRYVGVWPLLVVLVVGWGTLNTAPALGLGSGWSLGLASAATATAAAAVIALQRRRLRRIPREVWVEYKAAQSRTRVRRWGWVAYNLGTLLLVISGVVATFSIAGWAHSDALNVTGVLAMFGALPAWRVGAPWIWRRYIATRLR